MSKVECMQSVALYETVVDLDAIIMPPISNG